MMRDTLLVLLLAFPIVASAQPVKREDRSWSEEKCARYSEAWTALSAKRGVAGLSPEFRARHEAFLASGCTSKPDVCPRSAEELEVANILVVLAMNAGMASTFLPFACPKP